MKAAHWRRIPALALLCIAAAVLGGPSCPADVEDEAGEATAVPADEPVTPATAPATPEVDPCGVCLLGRELTPEEREICALCNQPPAQLAPAVATDPCSLCIEGRALTPEEQELCARCGGS